MIKIYIDNTTNKVSKYEPYTPPRYTEVIADFEITDSMVICETTWEICRLQDSSQGKARLAELISQSTKWLSEQEKNIRDMEIAYLSDETAVDKEVDIQEAQEILLSGQYIVNITTEDKKKKATVIELNPSDGVELDFDRWDRWFNSLEEAEVYANTFNS